MTRINPDPLSWAINRQDSTTTITLRGELDLATVLASKTALVDEFVKSDGSVVVDLGDIVFMDSSGLRLLLDLKARADEAGRSFRLGRTSMPVARVLDVTGVKLMLDQGGTSLAARK